MKPLKVYLCDLTHDTVILVSDTIPLNIGYVGSYAKKIHGDLIDLSLFKYPEKAIEAIKKDPPDVLALSNYSWNSLLSEKVAEVAKKINPKIVTVQGGPNFPHATELQFEFLKKRPSTNFHIMFEGEASFSNILERVIKERNNEQELFDYDSYNISHNKFDFGFYEVPQSFAISKNCEIYITGTTSTQDEPTDYLMIKLNKDLNLDYSFSQEGKTIFDIDAGIDEGNQILLLNDRSFIIGGRSNHGMDLGTVLFDYSLAKFNSKGMQLK